MDRSDFYHCFARLRQMFIILAQPPRATQPSERSLHHPSASQRNESPFSAGPHYHRYPVASLVYAKPSIQFAILIFAVALDRFQARMFFTGHLFEQQLSSTSIIHVGCGDDDGEQQPHGIDDDMALAAPNLLAAVDPDFLTTARGLDRLTIDGGDPRVRFAVSAATHPHTQRSEDSVPGAIACPGLEIVVHRLPGREIMRQGSPTTAFAVEVANGVDHAANIGFPRPTTRASFGYPRLDDLPLGVRQVRRITSGFHNPLYAAAPFWNRL